MIAWAFGHLWISNVAPNRARLLSELCAPLSRRPASSSSPRTRRGGRALAQRGQIGRTAYAETVRSEGVPAWEGSGMTLTPDQVKAGRELAGWSRLKLAARVNVCDQTIRRYERGEGAAATLDLIMVRQILESAGVEFIAENGGEAGARLRKATAE
jgi:ribosome-binding protein aMBF1 (putative translation factor)